MVFEILKKRDEARGERHPCRFKHGTNSVLVPRSKLAPSIIYRASLAAEDNSEDKGDGQAEPNTPDSKKEPTTTPQPVRALIYGEKGDSSVVKYKITATPGYVSTSLTGSFMQLYQLIKTSDWLSLPSFCVRYLGAGT